MEREGKVGKIGGKREGDKRRGKKEKQCFENRIGSVGITGWIVDRP